jgi:hypothetical protein
MSPTHKPRLALEFVLATATAAALTWHTWHLISFGYLAAPFFHEPSDTFMDWFNTAFWANDGGAYDTWQTIYPPLSFSILKMLSIQSCYVGNEGMTARDCDWPGLFSIGAIFTLNCVLAFVGLRRIDPATVWPRWFALCFGLPMLYALERGNILLLAFTFVLLAFTPILRSARLRWLALAMAINLKVYLLALLFPQLLKRRWRWFEGGLLFTLLVYLASYAHIGDGSPGQIINNIALATDVFEAGSLLDGWYTVTYGPFMVMLESNFIPIVSIIGSDAVESLLLILPILQSFSQALIAVAAVAVWVRPEAVPMSMVTLLGLLMALVTSESSGYTGMFLILFVFMQKWEGVGRPIAIFVCYLLSVPADFIIDRLTPAVRESFLFGGPVEFDFVFTLGPLLRPLAVQIVAWSIAASVIAMVRRDFAVQNGTGRRRFALEWLAPSGKE